jgi:beta-glucosidase
MLQGGGSASVTPHQPVTPLDGLRARLGDKVRFERGTAIGKRTPVLDTRHLDGRLHIEYIAGRGAEGDVVYEEDASRGYFVWLGRFSTKVPDDFSVRATATFVADEDGPYTLSLVQAGRARLYVDDELVVDNWNPTERSEAFFGTGSAEATGVVDMRAGERRELRVEFVPAAPAFGGLLIGARAPEPPDLEARAVAAAREADAVVLVVGTDADWESEGHDRKTLSLPGAQDHLVTEVLAANPRTVVVVNAASPIALEWADDAAAVMQVWFAGEELGTALTDVLLGDVSPSGKLPTTIPDRIEDTPAYKWYPGVEGKVTYGEGLFIGYRWYDAEELEPHFPFGFGLSYTTFDYGDVAASATTFSPDDGKVDVTVPVTNSGERAGAEIVQCYVRDVESTVERPVQELKAFAKVTLEPGETKTVTLSLDRRAFAFWDDRAHDWRVEPGTFEVRVGASSRDIRGTVSVECR